MNTMQTDELSHTEHSPGPLTEHIKARAAKSVLCWLATADPQGKPNLSPKEVWAIVDDRHIVVANIASPTSARNIRLNPQVCLSFIDVLVQKGFKVVGKATELDPTNPHNELWLAPLRGMVGERFTIRSILLISALDVHPIVAPSYLFHASQTTEASQIESARKTYGLRAGEQINHSTG